MRSLLRLCLVVSGFHTLGAFRVTRLDTTFNIVVDEQTALEGL